MSLPTEEQIAQAGPAEKGRILVGLRARLDSAPAGERPAIERLVECADVSLELHRGAAQVLREAEAAMPSLADVEEDMRRAWAAEMREHERSAVGVLRPTRPPTRSRGSGRPGRRARGRAARRAARRCSGPPGGDEPGHAGAAELRRALDALAGYEVLTDELIELLEEARAELRALRGER